MSKAKEDTKSKRLMKLKGCCVDELIDIKLLYIM